MSKRTLKLGAACAALVLTMTGCGNQIPDMTDEEMQMIGEYAAVTLLKYDANHRSRLVDTALLGTEEVEAVTPEPITTPEPTPEPAQESTSQTDTDASVIEQEEVIISVVDAEIETFYELPDNMDITYQGYNVCSSYPENAANDYFVLEADGGTKLLVLTFDINNGTSQEQTVDLFSSTSVYRLTLNGEYTTNALTTMLMNDMSTYVSAIPANSSQEIVLIAQIEESMADNISTITLKFENESKTYTISLF